MSRVDFEVDGEVVWKAHPHEEDDVRISLDGGDTYPLQTARWEHIVISVTTESEEE